VARRAVRGSSLKKLVLFVLFFSLKAISSTTVDCDIFAKYGCLVKNSENPSSKVLIFIRGLYERSGTIPEGPKRKQASMAAITFYQFEALAEEKGIEIFVTGSSHLGIDEYLFKLIKDRDYSLASHSGGYFGLFESLRFNEKENLAKPQSIYMLHNFYSQVPANLEVLKESLNNNIECLGFLTNHNLDRYKRLYQNLGCKIDGINGGNYSHSGSVTPCLKNYLEQKSCAL